MNTPLDKPYIRTPDFESRVAGLEFAPEVWSVFSRLDRARTAAEVAAELRLPPETAQSAFELLAAAHLIRKQVMGWNEFASTRLAPTPPPTQAPAPSAAASIPGSPPPKKSAESSAFVSLRLSSAKIAARPFVSLRITHDASPSKAAAPTDDSSRPWKLKPVLDAIGASVGGGIPGQLLVYKIFLQLPPDLVKAAKLESPAAVDAHFTVEDPRLRAAILEAARQHARLEPASLPLA